MNNCKELLEDRPTTAPNFGVVARGFDTKDRATRIAQLIGATVNELGRHMDLGGLDGVTAAYDYGQALLDLDRGYSTSHRPIPSHELAIGVAMTLSVIRDGKLKSHIVLNAGAIVALEDPANEEFGLALQLLAHECAHVEITKRFADAFPGFLLQTAHSDAHTAFRWQIILACWDEYAATCISARLGSDPTAGYEETFILALNSSRAKANECIKQYRTHGDVGRVMAEVYGAYGDLMKFSTYLLGTMAGRGLSLNDLPVTKAALEGHWYSDYFYRLDMICQRILDHYGQWSDKASFEALGDLADDLVIRGGLTVAHLKNGNLYVDVPFTMETMPA